MNWRQGSRQRPACTYQKPTQPLSPANWVLGWPSGVVASGRAKLGPRLEGLESSHRQNHFPIRSSPPIFIHIGHGSRSVPIRPLHFHPSTASFVCYSLLPTLLSGGCALGPVFFPKLSAVPVHGWLRHHPLKLFCFFHLFSFDNLLRQQLLLPLYPSQPGRRLFASGACPCCHSLLRATLLEATLVELSTPSLFQPGRHSPLLQLLLEPESPSEKLLLVISSP